VLISPADPKRQIPSLAANQFLVDAAKLPSHEGTMPSTPPQRSFSERAQWVAELFERLERADMERANSQRIQAGRVKMLAVDPAATPQ
jgi:hypothetical protein